MWQNAWVVCINRQVLFRDVYLLFFYDTDTDKMILIPYDTKLIKKILQNNLFKSEKYSINKVSIYVTIFHYKLIT